MGDASSILRLLLRRWPMLPLGVVLGIGGGILATGLMPPSYSSSSYVLVVPARDADGSERDQLRPGVRRIATNQAVIQKALTDQGIAVEPSRIRQLVSARPHPTPH